MNRKPSKSKSKLSVTKESLRKLSEHAMRSADGGCCAGNYSNYYQHTVQSHCCGTCLNSCTCY
jgi:hypothetical protein